MSAIVPAAGKGTRLGGGRPKQFLSVGGEPILVRTLKALISAYDFSEILIPLDPAYIPQVKKWIKKFSLKNTYVLSGGKTRAESVHRALVQTSPKNSMVLIHDAARPLISAGLIRKTLQAAGKSGAAICAMPITSTVKRVDLPSKKILRTEDRRELYLAQTPQVFRRRDLLDRYSRLGVKAYAFTDEASFFDGSVQSVKIIEGEAWNLKITTAADLQTFRQAVKKRVRSRRK